MFTENLKLLRTMRNVRQKWLADEIGVSENQVCRIETGRHRPDDVTIEKIAKALKCEVDVLLGKKSLVLGLTK